MRVYLDCYPCFLRQALEAARLSGADEPMQEAVVSRVLNLLQDLSADRTPPHMGAAVHRLVRDMTGCADPYNEVKQVSTREALRVVPTLRALVDEADDPRDAALRLAIAGNIIDHGVGLRYDLDGAVARSLQQPFAVDDRASLWRAVDGAHFVLYLADNAGETVFDRLLIEALGCPVIYAVKGGPTLNDATVADARAAGLDDVAEIIDTGSDAPGTVLDECSSGFMQIFDEAPVVLAKGQANYETLSDAGERVHLLLQAKCPVIARDIGVSVGSMIVKTAEG